MRFESRVRWAIMIYEILMGIYTVINGELMIGVLAIKISSAFGI